MNQAQTITVKSRYNGLRIDRFIAEALGQQGGTLTRERARELVQPGRILVDERQVRPSYRLKPGERVSVLPTESRKLAQGKGRAHLPYLIPTVLFENDDFLVLDKPAGLRIHPVRAGEGGTLAEWLLSERPQLAGIGDPERPGIVHRLDEATSGVLVVAKTQATFLALKRLFRDRKISKFYLALVYGRLKQKKGSIKESLGRLKGSKKRSIGRPKSQFSGSVRSAETKYELHTAYPHHSLISLEPKTGRTHQIRVHLASIGHPVVGDRLYRFKEHRKDLLQPPYQLLHAEKLAFELKGQSYSFIAPLPAHFREVLQTLDPVRDKKSS